MYRYEMMALVSGLESPSILYAVRADFLFCSRETCHSGYTEQLCPVAAASSDPTQEVRHLPALQARTNICFPTLPSVHIALCLICVQHRTVFRNQRRYLRQWVKGDAFPALNSLIIMPLRCIGVEVYSTIPDLDTR
jgi:hypothetical protein